MEIYFALDKSLSIAALVQRSFPVQQYTATALAAVRRYEAFLRSPQGQHILFLELGVGHNTKEPQS